MEAEKKAKQEELRRQREEKERQQEAERKQREEAQRQAAAEVRSKAIRAGITHALALCAHDSLPPWPNSFFFLLLLNYPFSGRLPKLL